MEKKKGVKMLDKAIIALIAAFFAVMAFMGCENPAGGEKETEGETGGHLLSGQFNSSYSTGTAVFYAGYSGGNRAARAAVARQELTGKLEDGDIVFTLNGFIDDDGVFSLSAGSSFLVYQISGKFQSAVLSDAKVSIRIKSGGEWAEHIEAVIQAEGEIAEITKPETPGQVPDSNFGPGVYVVGGYTTADGNSHAGYWRGVAWFDLEPSGAVSGSNVYITGIYIDASDSRHIGYWKNGTWTELAVPTGSEDVSVSGIAVSGSNVYVSGTRFLSSGYFHAGYWLNGTWNSLSQLESADVSSAFCVAVSGSNFVIGGYCRYSENPMSGSGDDTPCYWLNGTRTDLPSTSPAVGSIALSDTTVYACVSGGDYYINGTKQDLGIWGARDVAVSGGKIYLAGKYTDEDWRCGYSINGVWNTISLPHSANNTYADDIAVSGNTVYQAGNSMDFGGQIVGGNYKRSAYFWCNGEWVMLAPPPGVQSWYVGTGMGPDHVIAVATE